MTLHELQERIKEEVILHDGDLKEWQWRRNGLLTEAEQDGLSAAEFMRQVNDVSYRVGGLFPRIHALRDKITDYARADRKQLTSGHLNEIVTEAERLTLSRAFVADRWIPSILATIPDPAPVAEPVRPVAPPTPAPAPLPPQPAATIPAEPTPQTSGLSRDEIRRQVAARLDQYKAVKLIPAQALRGLYDISPADEPIITEEAFSYLVSNFYQATQEPHGNSLRDRLLSTDWHHLLREEPTPPPAVPKTEPAKAKPIVVRSFRANPGRVRKGEAVMLEWEVEGVPFVTVDDLGSMLSPTGRGRVIPSKTTNYHLFDPSDQPLSQLTVDVMPPNRSGFWGVLFAVALLLMLYWFLQSTFGQKNNRDTDRDRPKVERTTSETSEKTTPQRSRKTRRKKTTDQPEMTRSSDNAYRSDEPEAIPRAAKAIRPYDDIRDERGQYGEQQASQDGEWGLWLDDHWLIQPVYDDISVFRNKRATVLQNGQQYQIDINGERIR
ncbi:KWG Leptospira repeat protein [Fibrisoma limi BUZ 3]|uniref:KWG Leptospira repeat protein n=1 Tax=Fibrisoma limi BUZ 3 TaxID=1185876 RepID=I2GJV3_9BACT|nr:WG repeat-containing protein [Fibrisoma limi]CCH54178.1 KWG Leptospira repeat protein [Fibrisoma limi BUZ 3]